MTAMIQGMSAWLASNILALLALLMSGLMTLIGYKVHVLLDQRDKEQKIPDRLMALETTVRECFEAHEKRIDKIESKVFKL